jgi:single-strand DNA-binding protein
MRDLNSLNKVLLIGNLGADPDMRYLPQQDRKVARFNVATKERIFNPNTRESTDRTEWHRIVVWGKQAEFCEKFLTKGRQVLVEGRLQTRSWQDKEGNKRTTTEVVADNVVLLGRRESGAAAPDSPDYETRSYKEPGQGAGRPAPDEDVFDEPAGGSGDSSGGDDDIPF